MARALRKASDRVGRRSSAKYHHERPCLLVSPSPHGRQSVISTRTEAGRGGRSSLLPVLRAMFPSGQLRTRIGSSVRSHAVSMGLPVGTSVLWSRLGHQFSIYAAMRLLNGDQRQAQREANRRSYWRNRERTPARRAEPSDLARQAKPPTAPKTNEERRAAARERTRRYRERHHDDSVWRERDRAAKRASYHRRKEVISERNRARYPARRRAILARNKAYHEAHREELLAKARRRYLANPQAFRDAQRRRNYERYWNDPEAWLRYQRAWRQANLDRARQYVRLSGHRRRIGSGGASFTHDEWQLMLATLGGRCVYCGATEKLEMEHRTPLSRGGTNSIENIAPACRRCNRRKRTKTEDEFRLWLAREAVVTALMVRAMAA